MEQADPVAAIRQFNRFYTRRIGVLEEHLGASPFSLAEARLLYELANRDGPTATALARDLGIDAGYLSRLLRKLEDAGLILREAAAEDGRQAYIRLTEAGRAAFAPLDRESAAAVAAMIAPLPPHDRERLLAAMHRIESLLSVTAPAEPAVVLRRHQPGDIGWIIHRQGRLYAEEYGWDETYEGLVAEILSAFVKNFDEKRERAWIAEIDGAIAGSVFLVRQDDAVAKLRLLYVEPEARGLGLGARLVEECIAFARGKGYRTLTLWTNDILASARRIYEGAGFRLVSQGRHRSFGKDLVGQNWELGL
jgi:DNA-binding MarR family transcriptional regulator/N-acetylglutamate synthase-like GNAT family acetyltransferase